MAFGFFLVVHVLVSFFLIGVILIQGGRGGLGEALGGSGGSSLFGGGGNVVMTKITAVGAATFMVTCLFLAKLSTERGRSVIERIPVTLPELIPALPAPSEMWDTAAQEAETVMEQEGEAIVSDAFEVKTVIEEVPVSLPEPAAPATMFE